MSPFRERKPIICECGNHAFVAATRGYTTMVSPEDAHLLAERKWCACIKGQKVVRIRSTINGLGASLSHLVLPPSKGMWVDHRSSDGTDNRRSNLREATPADNARNRRPRKRSLPKGVAPRAGRFKSEIMVNGRKIWLGTFDTPEQAHAAYAQAAVKHFGEFARPS